MLVVSRERNSYLQEHRDQTHAVAVPPSSLSPGFVKAVARGEKRLQTLYKEFVAHDENGVALGRTTERSCVVTVLSIQTEDVLLIPLETAQACGFKTVMGFRGAWMARHPRTPVASVVYLAIGDWRDQSVYLGPSGRADYVSTPYGSIDPDAPALTREQMDALSSENRQKDDARRATQSRALASESPSQRLLRIDRYIDHLRATVGEEAARQAESAIRQHRRVIEQRVARAEKRKSGQGFEDWPRRYPRPDE